MNKEQILAAINELAKSQGFYGRFLHNLENDPQGAERVLANLEAQNFKDVIDLIIYLEG